MGQVSLFSDKYTENGLSLGCTKCQHLLELLPDIFHWRHCDLQNNGYILVVSANTEIGPGLGLCARIWRRGPSQIRALLLTGFAEYTVRCTG